MEWRDECRITAAFEAICEKQNEHEDRIRAIEEILSEMIREGEE